MTTTRQTSRWTSRGAVHALLLLAALYSVLPLVWLFTSATKNVGDFSTTSAFELGEWNLAGNLRDLFTEEGGIFLDWARNSLLYAGAGALLGALICTACGYAIARLDFPGRRLLFAVTLAGVLVPTTALALPLYLLATELRIVDTFWAVFIPLLTNPFGVYLARAYAEAAVPNELLEAARIDGAGELRTFVTVALPLLRPGVVTILLFQFVGIWNNFFLPLVMLTDPKLFPVTLGLFQWSSRVSQFPHYNPLVITGSLLAVVPLVLAFIVLQRQWRSGLAAGSVK
ncbi:multiple sugar transport system permease protein [Actinoalloteichus hoggarensis]|uniref:L-arabinose transport system permease protein AraQ n=1 Tax=Actinoalloteichus hoggarensis TaxID=1470176 RepID=A0A221W7R1_9PSEU|nr:carbohydrate ABC transporter permease [Actinoalloteichus hoggarensis]ASO22030.1 L-arabinose transport system permease protein AraQ [Actinoalloteichus hoggarensis]MBB5923889.1 multiple sugar transport system permease protein [Actinoalloteichus hoggarensis]